MEDNYEDLTTNQKQHQRIKKKKENPEFLRMINYDYDEDLINTHIGDEKRTFHVMKKNVPLLSPSRCLKWLNEHIWWSIPNKNLVKPRLFGQITHLSIEYYYKMDEYETFDTENILPWLKKDIVFWETWSKEIQEKFVRDLNIAIPKIITTLKENDIQVLRVEKHIANETFHGFVDILGWKTYKGTGLKSAVIVDLKTTTQPYIKPEHILQLAVYKKIMKDIPQTFILFYDTNKHECTLEQIYQKDINNTYKKIKDLIDLFR